MLRIRSERRSSLLPSRRDIRNRHFGFSQIKNSSKRKTSLRTDGFILARDVVGGPKFDSWPPTSDFFSDIWFNPIKRIQPGKVEASAHAGNRWDRPRVKIPAPASLYGTSGCCVQSRKLRTDNHVVAFLFHCPRHELPAHANVAVSPSPAALLDPKNAIRAQRDETASHFSGIGVLSAQRSSDIVSLHLPLKYRSSSHGLEQMPDNC
jgi:hypothetical protein